MTLSHHDHEVESTSTTKSVAERRSQASHTSWWVFAAMALAIAFAGGLALAAILGDSPETTAAFAPDVVPDYAVDTPAVIYAPADAVGFLGADANLDPDAPLWWNAEYGSDTAAVFYAPIDAPNFIGEDANLDPDQ